VIKEVRPDRDRQLGTISTDLRLVSQHIRQCLGVEQVSGLLMLPEHAKAHVSSQALEVARVGASLHAGFRRATFQAVPSEVLRCEACQGRPELDDAGYGAGHQGCGADRGEGRGGWPCRLTAATRCAGARDHP
jgi:hypothetical protein